MDADIESKVCPLCAETIKAAAKVCPHCRHSQKILSFRNPVFMTTVIFTIYMVLAAFFLDKLFGPRENFAKYHDEIQVLSSHFSYRVSGSNVYVTVVGTITNRSSIGWKEVEVEAQFFDQSGKLIDVIAASGDGWRGVGLIPHGDAGFKIETKAARREADYSSHKAFVRAAKDAGAWP
jgi:hypothetical protein